MACFLVSLCQKWCGKFGLLIFTAVWIGHDEHLSYFAFVTLPWFHVPPAPILPSPWHNPGGVNNFTCPHESNVLFFFLFWVTVRSSPSKDTARTFLIFDSDWTGGIYLYSNLTFAHNSKLNTDVVKGILPQMQISLVASNLKNLILPLYELKIRLTACYILQLKSFCTFTSELNDLLCQCKLSIILAW